MIPRWGGLGVPSLRPSQKNFVACHHRTQEISLHGICGADGNGVWARGIVKIHRTPR